MMASRLAMSMALMLLATGCCYAETTSARKNIAGRRLKQYEGCSEGSWGSVCTTNNGDGTSTVCTRTAYYNGCESYPNDSLPPTPPGATTTTTTTTPEASPPPPPPALAPSPAPAPGLSRRLLTTDNSNKRSLKAFEGCSRGSWGSVCSTDNEDGTTTVCVETSQYTGCTTYPNDKLPKLQVDGESILLSGSEDSLLETVINIES